MSELSDDDITTEAGGGSPIVAGDGTDGTDGAGTDTDGTDGAAGDGVDGDGTDGES